MKVLFFAIVFITVVAVSASKYEVTVELSEYQYFDEQQASLMVVKLDSGNDNLIKEPRNRTIYSEAPIVTTISLDQAILERAKSLEFAWTSDQHDAKPIRVEN